MDIFVAKLNSDTTPDDLKQLFGQYGNVLSTKVIMDKETGRSKCYGFVEMQDEAEGANAIEQLNDFDFMGNNIAVKKSAPKSKNQDNRSFDRRPRRDFNRDNRGGGYNQGGGRDSRGGGYGRDNRGGGYNRDNRGGGYNRDNRGGDRNFDRDRNDRYSDRDRDFNRYE